MLVRLPADYSPEKKYQNLNDCVAKVLDLKEYHRRIAATEVPAGTRIAIICSPEDYDQFGLETRAITTGMPVFPRVFRDVNEAARWLMK